MLCCRAQLQALQTEWQERVRNTEVVTAQQVSSQLEAKHTRAIEAIRQQLHDEHTTAMAAFAERAVADEERRAQEARLVVAEWRRHSEATNKAAIDDLMSKVSSTLLRVRDSLLQAHVSTGSQILDVAAVEFDSAHADAKAVKAFGAQLEALVQRVVSSAASSTHAQLDAVHASQVSVAAQC